MISAMTMVPLMAFSGCAVDTARMYFVKMRLQQACDAGVLAGRRFMADTSMANTTLDTTASAQANAFFNNNFRTGWFGAKAVGFTPTKTSEAQVAGTAVATLPMTLMSMFGVPAQQIRVACEARYDVADTDVLFVLDTTGSMACLPQDDDVTCNNYVRDAGTTSFSRPADGTGSGNVSTAGYPGSTAFYVPEKSGSRMAALRAAVLGFYDTLASAADPSTNIRYGFVTYASSVNAGKAIMQMSPAYMVGGTGNANKIWNYQSRSRNGNSWNYQQMSYDVSMFVGQTSVTDPSKTGGNSSWPGCIEERFTTSGTTTFSQLNLPNDLNPDLIPTGDIQTQWKPAWSDVVYIRNAVASSSAGELLATATGYGGPAAVACGKPVSRLKTMTRTQVSNYVNATDFRALGGTYHDIGMIWGTRMLSTKGIFATDNGPWPGHNATNKVIVFLTDGDMSPNYTVYGAYGVEFFDRRISKTTDFDSATLKAYHNARFLAECTAAKARNISVWTVSIDSAATSEMTKCATVPAQALYSTTGTGLSDAFAAIAKQIAMLRITR
ncbi:Tad domain-containing protein [Sphingomonas montanisoli]|nr:Tad domain-containing protein [Sphingomonas montanisoli]